MGVEASVIVACGTRRTASTSRVLAACLALASLAGCSFERSPLVSADHRASVAPPSSSGGGAGNEPDPPSTQPPVGKADASAPAGGSDAAKPPVDAATSTDASLDATTDAFDAGHDGGSPDTGTPDSGCGETPACVCAHDRLETPADPCAAPDCPLAECAPDDDCVLKRFGSSVYYFCSNARDQSAAQERCETIEGMHLVYIEGEDEDDFLDGHVEGKVWIGAGLEGGVWGWLDGTPFYDEESGDPIDGAYVDWDGSANEPNGLGVGMGSVSCAILWSDTGAWADTNCTALNPYVCEREL